MMIHRSYVRSRQRVAFLLLLVLVSIAFGCDDSTLQPPVHQSKTATALSVKDNTLYEDTLGTVSSGAGGFMFAGRNSQGDLRRALVQFDIVSAGIPTGASIDSVRLTLHMSRTNSGENPVALHRVLTAWGEAGSGVPNQGGRGAPAEPGDATWIHTFYDTAMWSNRGGDFVAGSSAMTQVDTVGFYSWSSPSMAADAQRWLDDPASNFGWILVGNESVASTTKQFATKENPTADTRPVLILHWTTP